MANGGNPNTNPKCGSQISIRNPASGIVIQATVVDTCVSCAMYDIDVTSSLFTQLEGGLTAGRVPVDWGAYMHIYPRPRRDKIHDAGETNCFCDRVPRAGGAQGQGETEETSLMLGQLALLVRRRGVAFSMAGGDSLASGWSAKTLTSSCSLCRISRSTKAQLLTLLLFS